VHFFLSQRGEHGKRVERSQEAQAVKLHYYPETDSLYIDLAARPSAQTREIADGLNADFDADGALVGLDIDGASKKLDLVTIETVALPIRANQAISDALRTLA
jgi:uncharacterized protein YuzE